MTDAADDDPIDEFWATTSGVGGPPGGLPDITGMSVTIEGDVADPARFFATSVARHHAALDAYGAALEAAKLDVTDDRVIAASTDLHSSLTGLAIAHTAFAGSGFPSPLVGSEARTTRPRLPDPESMPRVSPPLYTAITGTLSQRIDVADLRPIPLEAQLVLARDPDAGVRGWLLGTDELDRATVLLMERDETDPDIRSRLGEELFSSIEAKRATPLFHLRQDTIQMACDQLGLSKSDYDRVWKARLEIEDSLEFSDDQLATTLGDVIDRLGLV